jgi:CHAD domain-containing protein
MSEQEILALELVVPAIGSVVERTRAAASALSAAGASSDTVHDFRVALRRQRSVLEVARGLFDRDTLDEIDAVLWRHGQATGALRDADVLDETLAASMLDARSRAATAAWLAEQRAREDELRGQAVALVAGPELDACQTALLALLAAPPSHNPPIEDVARRRFARAVRRVQAHLPVAPADAAALHRLRIRFKRLRYVCELLGQFMAVVSAREVSERQRRAATAERPRFEAAAQDGAAMQKALGLLHDADEAIAVIPRARLDGDVRAAVLTALDDLRRRLAERALAQLAALPRELVGASPVQS